MHINQNKMVSIEEYNKKRIRDNKINKVDKNR